MNFFQNFLQVQSEIPSIDPQIVFEILGVPIATSTLMIFLIALVFLVIGLVTYTTFRVYPTKFQVLVELLHDAIQDLLDEVTNDKNRSQILFPIIASMFVYLLFANLIGLIPGLSEITVNGASLFKTPTADFNTTFGLALGAVIIINLVGIKEWGVFNYLGNFVKIKHVFVEFRKGIGSGAIALVDFFVGLLDIVGEFAKVISLSIRLFANMYAGQILMIILMGAFAYGIPAIWYGMNIFVGALQAMVFATLVAAYYMLAVKPTNESDEQKLDSDTTTVPEASVAEAA